MIPDALFRAASWSIRRIGAQTVASLVILWIVLASVASGIAALNRGLEAALLLETTSLALLAGRILARSRLPAWLGGILSLLLGFGLLTLRLSNPFRPLLDLLTKVALYIWQLLQWPSVRLPDPAPLWVSFQATYTPVVAVLARFFAWSAALLARRPAFDPAAATLAWGLAIWLAAAWAAWAIRRWDRPLPAIFPSAALLASSLNYTRADPLPLLPVLAGTLLLVAIHHFDRQERQWQREDLDYYADLRKELVSVVLLVTLAVTSIASVAPGFSINRLANFARNLWNKPNQPIDQIASSLGLQARTSPLSPLDPLANPGLPRQHLIGSGPELQRQPVMAVVVPGWPPATTNGEPAQPPRLYWRGLTYDGYTGHGWRTSGITLSSYQAGEVSAKVSSPAQQELLQKVTPLGEAEFHSSLGGLLYSAGIPVQVDQDYRLAKRSQGDLFGGLVASRSYQANSLISVASAEQLRSAGNHYPDWVLRRYLSLSQAVPERVLTLARDLTAAQPTPYDRATAIESYLRAFPYTLDLPAPPYNRDIVDYFLFDLRKGYCDYYATAMVILARAAGVPARLVTGYASGDYDPASHRFLVTAADAHSWVEVYFPTYGWIEFEPTAGRPAINRPAETSTNELPLDQARSQNPSMIYGQASRYAKISLFILAGALLIGLVAWSTRDILRLQALSPAEAAIRLYQLLRWNTGKLDIPVDSGDTPYEFSRSLRDWVTQGNGWQPGRRFLAPALYAVQQLVELYVRADYSPRPPDSIEQGQAIQAWRVLRWRLWGARMIKRLSGHKTDQAPG